MNLHDLDTLGQFDRLAKRRSVDVAPENGIIHPIEHRVVVGEDDLAVPGTCGNPKSDIGLEIVDHQLSGKHNSPR